MGHGGGNEAELMAQNTGNIRENISLACTYSRLQTVMSEDISEQIMGS